MATKWEDMVKYALANQKVIVQQQERRKKQDFYKKLRRIIPIPILMGVIAAITMQHLYGWPSLIETLLGWTIGLTIVATIIAYLPKNLTK